MEIKRRFGMDIDVNGDININERNKLNGLIAPLKAAALPGTKFYIAQISMSWDATHYGVSGLNNRLQTLETVIRLGKNPKSRFIDLGLPSSSQVQVTRTDTDIRFTIPCSYILTNSRYVDYIAVLIPSNNKKPMLLDAYARATTQYAQQLQGYPGGSVKSTLNVPFIPL
jgi:hypothetical protein